jgi:molecular chaperone DnaK (HSP70)
MTGLPPGLAGSTKIELTVTVDVESILHVEARELKTGKSAQVKIQPSGGLSQDDIVNIVRRRRRETIERPA